VPDTALHTVRLVDVWEAGLGRPVLTANQVSAWHGLRLAGWQGRASGLGALFDSERASVVG
jgi:maleate cis-trans isomerase